jgi:hypothetical protein
MTRLEPLAASPSANTDASAHGRHALFALAFDDDLIDLPVGSRGDAAPCGSSLGGELVTLPRGDCDEIYLSASPRRAILYITDLLVDQTKPPLPADAVDQPNPDEVDYFLTGGNT